MNTKSNKPSAPRVSDAIRRYFPQYWGIAEYPADLCAAFCKVDEPWGIFSNFARTPIHADGREYSCVEQMFQCLKFTDPDVIADIMAVSGQTIKMKAKHWVKQGKTRPDWPAILVDVLKRCLRLKLDQSPEFRQALVDSAPLFIVEDQTTFPRSTADAYGCKLIGKKYVGPNLMGRLLMELRSELLNASASPQT